MSTQTPTPAPDAFSRACSSREALHHLTGRWGALTMAALGEGPMRFNELRRRVDGISDRMLAQTLADLERDGMITREVHSTIPPHVVYQASPLGADAAEQLGHLIHLLESRFSEVLTARLRYDQEH